MSTAVNQFFITDAGRNIIANALQNELEVTFTRGNLGSGYQEFEGSITSMATPLYDMPLSNHHLPDPAGVNADTVNVIIQANNLNIASSFVLREIGLFAQITGQPGTEILFAYASDEQGETINTVSESAVWISNRYVDTRIAFGSPVEFTVNLDGSLVTQEDLEDMEDKFTNITNYLGENKLNDVIAGNGITVATSKTGSGYNAIKTATITNTGVLQATAGANITLSGNNANQTIAVSTSPSFTGTPTSTATNNNIITTTGNPLRIPVVGDLYTLSPTYVSGSNNVFSSYINDITNKKIFGNYVDIIRSGADDSSTPVPNSPNGYKVMYGGSSTGDVGALAISDDVGIWYGNLQDTWSWERLVGANNLNVSGGLTKSINSNGIVTIGAGTAGTVFASDSSIVVTNNNNIRVASNFVTAGTGITVSAKSNGAGYTVNASNSVLQAANSTVTVASITNGYNVKVNDSYLTAADGSITIANTTNGKSVKVASSFVTAGDGILVSAKSNGTGYTISSNPTQTTTVDELFNASSTPPYSYRAVMKFPNGRDLRNYKTLEISYVGNGVSTSGTVTVSSKTGMVPINVTNLLDKPQGNFGYNSGYVDIIQCIFYIYTRTVNGVIEYGISSGDYALSDIGDRDVNTSYTVHLRTNVSNFGVWGGVEMSLENQDDNTGPIMYITKVTGTRNS